jgi:predicted DNA-binding transcriptional regulator YafY
MNRTERLFAITEHLRGRRSGTTAEAIADRFGVTLRTVFRDLASLREAGLPIIADRGRGGGVALDRGYTLPPVSFSAREAAVLISACRWLHRMRVIPFSATLESALDKVQGALSASAQRELLARLETLSYVGVPARTAKPAVLKAIEQAFFDQSPLWIRYQGPSETTDRTVRVDAVVMERSETLLNVWDLEKGAARQMKLDRIVEARLAAV